MREPVPKVNGNGVLLLCDQVEVSVLMAIGSLVPVPVRVVRNVGIQTFSDLLERSVGSVGYLFGIPEMSNHDIWRKIAFALEKSIRDAFWLILTDDGCRVGLCSFTWANQFIEWLVSQGIKMPTPDDFSRRMEIDPGSSSREGVRDELHAES